MRNPRRWTVALVAVGLVLAIVGGVVWWRWTSAPRTEGPFSTGDSGWATSLDVGSEFTNGWLVLQNTAADPVTIRKIEPVISGSGLRFLGVRLAGPERRTSIQQEPRFPPTDKALGQLHDVASYVMKPGPPERHLVEVLLGFRVVAPGRSTVTAVDVSYEVNGRSGIQRLVSTLAVCAPKTTAECPQEYAGAF